MSKYEEPPVEWIGKGSFGDVETVIRSWDQKVTNNVTESSVGAGTDTMLLLGRL